MADMKTYYTDAKVAELRAAFERVENPENWKFGIDYWVATLSAAEKALISEAVIFFTGSTARFSDDPEGKTHVTAAGYYMAIGA